MIDEYNADRTGWARFSDDRQMRYRLARSFTGRGRVWITTRGHSTVSGTIFRVVFLLLNPSTADAFKPDLTVTKCCEFAKRWGADVLEVVNLFALRSTDPQALYAEAHAAPGACGGGDHAWLWSVGGDETNDAQIIEACRGASRVVTGWGNHGALNGRGDNVAAMLDRAGIQLMRLATTDGGYPKHPLARGKHFIPLDREPEVWTP